MAISRVVRSQLRLVLENGTNPTNGDIVLKTKSFANVQTNATADQLYAVGNAFAGLQTLPLFGIERYDYAKITTD